MLTRRDGFFGNSIRLTAAKGRVPAMAVRNKVESSIGGSAATGLSGKACEGARAARVLPVADDQTARRPSFKRVLRGSMAKIVEVTLGIQRGHAAGGG